MSRYFVVMNYWDRCTRLHALDALSMGLVVLLVSSYLNGCVPDCAEEESLGKTDVENRGIENGND